MQKVAAFFTSKGLAALKEEDRAEGWYADWIEYQAKHGLYAGVLSPKACSTRGCQLDLLKLTRFWEVFAYFSPAHAYSLHVSFLGLFPILRGDNEALKREAVAKLEAGGLFAFAVSEREHGSDLLGNEFTVTEVAPGKLSARGSKYYIGNANAAGMVSVLAKKARGHGDGASRRAPLLFFVLRPGEHGALRAMRKIRTMGIRTAYVAAFEVDGYEFPESDVVCRGRAAWEAVFATVNLGKFFLGFGSIGMCEHALEEARAHTRGRTLYGKPDADMPHICTAMAHAYARLTAMKLFAYRALDYLHAATKDDRRYLLFAAVQKAKVSSEGVKVMALLSECIGAKGFEADTYFESALRDVPLIPSLEGSTHINYEMAAQFLHGYFAGATRDTPPAPPSLAARGSAAGENPYLLESEIGDAHLVRFAHYLDAYRPLASVPNVRLFARQVRAFRLFLLRGVPVEDPKQDVEVVVALGKCLSAIAYAQLVAEHCVLADVPPPLVSVLFHQCVEDLSVEAMRLAALPQTGVLARLLLGRVPVVPRTPRSDLDFVARRVAAGA